MGCNEEYEKYLDAVNEFGPRSEEARVALDEFYKCIRFMDSIHEGRDSFAASKDEALYLHMKRMREAWDELFGKIKPRPGPYMRRTLEVRNKIFSNPETAMLFSEALTEAFKKSGIELKENEIFEFTLNIREKPAYISELLSSTRSRDYPPVDFFTDNKIMSQLMKEIERDRLRS